MYYATESEMFDPDSVSAVHYTDGIGANVSTNCGAWLQKTIGNISQTLLKHVLADKIHPFERFLFWQAIFVLCQFNAAHEE